MRRLKGTYVHLLKDWPEMSWDHDQLWPLLSTVRHKQGKLRGYLEMLAFDLRSEALLHAYSSDVLKSSEIEGAYLNPEQVRSSVARRLGLEFAGMVDSDRNVDAVVTMMLDATQLYKNKVTKERLCGWQAALFPNGYSGLHKITVGDWRKDDKGPMQVVSGPMGKEKIHFEAPHADRLKTEMRTFLNWLNTGTVADQVVKSGVAHFWFVTVHPFDDGNGRVGRALSDMLLARSEDSALRCYSLSEQIRKERSNYYEMLEKSSKGDLDLTQWLLWYLRCLERALDAAELRLQNVFRKTRFWDEYRNTEVNERQRKVLNKLFDGFDGKLTTSKWAKMNKCSGDTALRDVTDLVKKGMLQKEEAGGRSTSYKLP